MTDKIGYVFDDGGRAKAGYKKFVGDCFVRAIAISTGIPYLKVYRKVAREFKYYAYPETGNADILDLYRGFLKPGPRIIQELIIRDIYGFERISLKRDSAKPTFTQAYEEFGDCIIDTYDHTAALKKGNLRDIDDWVRLDVNYNPRKTEPKVLGIWKN